MIYGDPIAKPGASQQRKVKIADVNKALDAIKQYTIDKEEVKNEEKETKLAKLNKWLEENKFSSVP